MYVHETDPILTSRRRYFRRTSVYIAEYIIMLVLIGSLVGVVASSIYSFFNFLDTDGFSAKAIVVALTAQLAALVVLAPATYLLYARVTGQEAVHPELRLKQSRTVFLSIWLIGMVFSIVGVAISVVAGLLGGVMNNGDTGVGDLLVRIAVPGIIVLVLLKLAVFAVVRHSSRTTTIRVGIAIAIVLAVVFIGNLVLAVNKNNSKTDTEEPCTYARYADDECDYSAYREYRNESRTNYNSSSRSGGFENIYQSSYRDL